MTETTNYKVTKQKRNTPQCQTMLCAQRIDGKVSMVYLIIVIKLIHILLYSEYWSHFTARPTKRCISQS